MKQLFTFCLLIVTLQFTFAQWINIDHPLLEGGRLSNFEVNNSDLFLATNGGIYKSIDNGANWNNSYNGFAPHSNWAEKILKHTTGLYAQSDRLYTSVDGDLWSQVNPTGFPVNYNTMDFEEANDLLFAIVADYDISEYHLYYSANGTAWNQGASLGTFAENHKYRLMNFSDTCLYISIDTLLLHTSDGINLINIDLSGFPYGQGNFNANSFSPEPNGDFFYYVSESASDAVYRYSKTTGTWTDVTNNLPSSFASYNVVKAGDNAVFVTVITFVPSLSVNVYRSLDHGGTWTLLTGTGLGTFPYFDKFMQISPGEYIFSDILDNLFYSDDNGSTWTLSNNGFKGKDCPKLFQLNNVLLTYNGTQGVMRSTDNGSTWSYSNSGLPLFFADMFFVGDMQVCGTDVWITFAADPNVGNFDLYKSSDMGASWTIDNTIPDSTNIRFAGGDNSCLIINLFNHDENNCLYLLTNNGGTTWLDFTTSLAAVNLKENYGFKGNNNSVLYLFGTNVSDEPVIFHVTANATSYWEISTGLDKFNFKFEDWGNYHSLPICDFTSTGDPIIVVPRFDLYPNSMQLYRFDYTGTQWNMISSSGLPPEIFQAFELVNHNGTWFLSTPNGIFKSTDDCVTWTTAIPGNVGLLMGMRPCSIQFINDLIYLGTDANSIWMADLATGSEMVSNIDAQLYPNPATDFIKIDNYNFTSLTINDLFGKEVMKPAVENGLIDISELASGVYILNIYNSESVCSKKFIKL